MWYRTTIRRAPLRRRSRRATGRNRRRRLAMPAIDTHDQLRWAIQDQIDAYVSNYAENRDETLLDDVMRVISRAYGPAAPRALRSRAECDLSQADLIAKRDLYWQLAYDARAAMMDQADQLGWQRLTPGFSETLQRIRAVIVNEPDA